MSLIACPECSQQVSNSAPVCPHCGYPLSPTTNPYQPPQQVVTGTDQGQRRPYFQYGLLLGAFPMAITGIMAFLESRGWQFSDAVLGVGIAICIVPAAGLLAYSVLDRLFINRGKPVARLRASMALSGAILLAAVVWLGAALAM